MHHVALRDWRSHETQHVGLALVRSSQIWSRLWSKVLTEQKLLGQSIMGHSAYMA